MVTTCHACGQPVPAPTPAEVPAAEPEDGLQAFLNDDERGRGVRAFHELGQDRQPAVRSAMKAKEKRA